MSSTFPNLQVQRTGAIALTVSDVDRSTAFYTQVLEFELVSDLTLVDETLLEGRSGDVRVRVVRLRLGVEQIELMQYLNVESQPLPPDSRSNDLWFQHFAIVVSDMEAAYARLRAVPVEPISSGPQVFPPENEASAHIRAFKFKDPDRHNLEIIWFPPDKSQDKWQQPTDRLFLGIDHSAIAAADTEAGLRFYRDRLGLPMKGQSFNWREVQARLDDLPSAAVQVTSLQPDQGAIGIELLDYRKPGTGRPTLADWQRSDIPHMHIELFVTDLEAAADALGADGVETAPLKLVKPEDSSLYRQGVLIKDPNGHALLLLELE
ncbi:MAG: VOC family protein [Nodosilinea sp.]